ncbi:MAG TPA: DNA-directed RNA polymerase subunit beta [candidate division Zixibacteria bacterium]|nr:DNA-directed RNA polymerase subunit beta [candidate division Zixibacteria bacterium]MDM7973239.1 DNA-directed RNA polymerase subunit beta [candidate division Zixibacteria bacterium]HPM37238.1 DNA-directed RNA polymerase subunit beta [candidate division Zixibacteria bacterium]
MATASIIERKSYGVFRDATEMPNLLEVQLESYREFLQPDTPPDKRKRQGLHQIFLDIFPITDIHENYSLEYVGYHLGPSRYTIDECRARNMTYAAPLRVTMRLISRQGEGEKKEVKDIIEQDVYLGELPLLTEWGTFIVNGAERVVVSQLHRSPGVFFDEDMHPNGKKLYSARIIPYRGSWVEFAMDINDVMYVYIDSRRKMPATTLLRAIGYSSDEEILNLFYKVSKVNLKGKSDEDLATYVLAETIVNTESGEVILEPGETLDEEMVEKIAAAGYKAARVVDKVTNKREAYVILNTLRKDPTKSREEALMRIYALVRPGEPPTLEMAESLLEKFFFNNKRYDLGEVGRYMINHRMQINIDLNRTTLDPQDFVAIVKYLVGLVNDEGYVDDIDHLGNRRARTVGELMANLFSVGLSRVARTIRERLSLKDQENVTPQLLVNARTVSTVVETFFGSSQLSQFMDQTNPLSELTHKRRLSALGPGGLTRERAGFEVRDVHHTHYGRMCPIETPEGPNIGLITSLATFARINKYGFLETPYRKAVNGKVTDQIDYLSADEEDRYFIAQANEPLDKNGRFVNDKVLARRRSDYPLIPASEVQFMDVSPRQIVSVAASLIPFLEHDDANRALMGSNMQRQAVPLLRTQAPFVGTGMERKVAEDAGAVIKARRAGEVVYVDARQVVIRPDVRPRINELGWVEDDVYELTKYRRSNQDTCILYKPNVALGTKVAVGDVVANGPAVENGELALGYNVLVAFMPWRGYNYEDAIILSERLMQDDIFTSVHVEEYELQVRDTKRGSEEITREIPNVSEEALLNLDENGIVRIGAEVEAGDILVGKVTPKGETELSPEERLLRAIFGEKAGDVRDASLKAPPGMKGVVIKTQVFSRKERTEEAKRQEKTEVAAIRKTFNHQIDQIKKLRAQRIGELLDGKTSQTVRSLVDNSVVVRAGHKYKADFFENFDFDAVVAPEGFTTEANTNKHADAIVEEAARLIARKQQDMEVEVDKVVRGAELPPGVKQLVKVTIAIRRKISVGDKMAGRHGNKGVVSKLVPVEDMPHMEDGTPVDIILNPLGVPSRMNVGQILETHLGWAVAKLGERVATPVFEGADIEEIKRKLRTAGLPEDGKLQLFDGRSGEPFDNPVTVGYIYMLKLSHLVDDKIHARSIGPYSLVTQQPLGGKAQFGGQRFGEMEVWALEAYGAAYTLQEMLTVKSDDVTGRSRIYEAIVKGENPPEPGYPEAFNVLIKELQALGLDVKLLEK